MPAQTSTHATLLIRLQAAGDGAAWGDFVRRYGSLIRAVAHRHGLQAADADDVLQDVLLGLSKAMPSFEYDPNRARFRTFLQKIVQRAIFRKFRQKGGNGGIESMATIAEDESRADEIWEADWRQYHMRRAMETIEVEFGPRDREIFSIYVGEGRAAAETAEAVGVNIDQVYQAKSKILARLSELIAVQIEEEG